MIQFPCVQLSFRYPPVTIIFMDSNFSQRLTVLAVTCYLSVCLLLQGFLPNLAGALGQVWIMSGLFGLVSCFGLLHLARRESEGQKILIDNIKHDAQTDALTQIANRRTFDAHLAERMKEARVEGSQVLIAILDIDHFKQINDSHGHAVGDNVLKFVAENAIRTMEGNGLVARIGGDEFAFISNGQPSDRLLTSIAMLAAKVEYQTTISNSLVPVTLSIGVAISRSGEQGLELFNRADTALYKVKEKGRNGIEVHDGIQPKPIQEFVLSAP